MAFKQEFFKIYDRAIDDGVCSFSQTGIRKDHFIKLCTEPDFVLDEETIKRACTAMKISEEKTQMLIELAREAEA